MMIMISKAFFMTITNIQILQIYKLKALIIYLYICNNRNICELQVVV